MEPNYGYYANCRERAHCAPKFGVRWQTEVSSIKQ